MINNLLVLYNPYYNNEVIELHLELLKKNGVVAFGKVRSTLRDYEHPNQETLDEIYNQTSKENPLQIFLTDYNSIYVANVISVNKDIKFIKVPQYYEDLEVEYWFVFDDLRLIVHHDFELIRDKVLTNFKATNFNNRTYAIYGNPYVYPMQITMKEEINYFEKEDEKFKFYTDIFKSQEQLLMKQNLIDFNFGKEIFYSFTPNSQDNIISAEIEYMQNKENILYDFSAVVLKYAKAVEDELYRFMKKLFKFLMEHDGYLKAFPYQVQGRKYQLQDIINYKPNFGTYAYLIKSYEIKKSLHEYIQDKTLKHFILFEIPMFIKKMQNVRNESVHGNTTSFQECNTIREEVIGIGKKGMLSAFIQMESQV